MNLGYFRNVIQNFFGVILCLFFFVVFITLNQHFNKKIKSYFLFIALTIFLLAISDAFQGFYETLSYPTWQRKLFACFSYCLRPTVLYAFSLIFLRNSNRKTRLLIIIPIAINLLIVFSSFVFTKAVFYYTENNEIVRSYLVASPFIVSLFYFGFIIYFGSKRAKYGDFEEFVVISAIAVSSIVATLLELYLRFSGLICTVAVIGLPFYYAYFLSFSYSFDQLTGAYLRKKLFDIVPRTKGYYTIISLDMNDLKGINDTYGHIKGDAALVSVAQSIVEVLPEYADLFRMGGDEFVILDRTTDEEEVISLVKKIVSKVKKTGYSVAVGYSIKNIFKTFEQALEEADNLMYKAKTEYKEKHQKKTL